ncbi:MAG: repeat-containing protein [Mucilaginibacter sp.]|nr:repeat-containing protein [Mucilaginibacter sp.]
MKPPYSRTIQSPAFLLFLIFSINGCTKTSTPASSVILPTVSTTSVIINLTSTTAQSGGMVTFAGGGTITKNGVCYSSANKTPTTADSKTADSISIAGTTATTFTGPITGLVPNTTYYLRAYATNSAGTAYGSVIQFTTPGSLSAVTTAVTTFAGNGTPGYLDASGLSAQFNNPQGVSVDSRGNVYVSDSYNSLIREITPAGSVSTMAGNQTIGYNDGQATAAQFYGPAGSAFDVQGNLYVADLGNNVIRKITPSGVVSTYAGTGIAGYYDGAATLASKTGSTDVLAQFNSPQAVAVDASGNLYVADRGNNMIRKITTAGRVSTIAGVKAQGFIDATGTAAAFNGPSGVAVDAQGNIYVTDEGNSAIRKITTANVVTTIAGNPTENYLLNYPSAITIDKQGNLYITDADARVIEFTTSNVLYFLAGKLNVSGFVNGTGTSALFTYPQGIAVDASGNLYIADQYNNCIRKVAVTWVP